MVTETIESASGIEKLIKQAKREISLTKQQTTSDYKAVVRDLRARYIAQFIDNIYVIWGDLPQWRTENRPYGILLRGLTELLRDQERHLQKNLTDCVFKQLRAQGLAHRRLTDKANRKLTALKTASLAKIHKWTLATETDSESELSESSGEFETVPDGYNKSLIDLDYVRFLWLQYQLELALVHKIHLINQLNETLRAPVSTSVTHHLTSEEQTEEAYSRAQPRKNLVKSLFQRYYRATMTNAPVKEYQPKGEVFYARHKATTNSQPDPRPTDQLINKVHRLNSHIYALEEKLSVSVINAIYQKLGLLDLPTTHGQIQRATDATSLCMAGAHQATDVEAAPSSIATTNATECEKSSALGYNFLNTKYQGTPT